VSPPRRSAGSLAPGGTGGVDAGAPDRAEEHPPGGNGRGSEFVQSLERGLAVIRAFGPGHSRLTLTEVAKQTGLTRAAARRFLLTLVELGYVHNDGREFSLRPRVLELGYAYLSGLSLAEVAQPHVEELVAAIHESSSISVLDGGDIVYVVRVPTRRIMTVAISVGTRFPAYCTSMGRVLLASRSEEEREALLAGTSLEARTGKTSTSLDELRRTLGEVRAQELEDGLIALAVPIHDGSGNVVAAMNVSANALRVSPELLEADILPPLREAARRIEEGLRAAGLSSGPHGGRNRWSAP